MSTRSAILIATVLAACGFANPSAHAARDVPAPAQAAPPASDPNDPVVARVNGVGITRSQIMRPLLEGYGANVLINVSTYELAKQEAAIRKLTITQQDIDTERDTTLAKLFGDSKKEDYPNLLEQFLQQQRISRPEFDIWLATNAYLRKIAEPMVKANITEDRLQESFKALYGETVQIRHIQCGNLQEITEAKRRLAAGETFEKVAQTMSRNNRTAPMGGLMPAFSRYADYPEVFKDVAFSLKPGEVSDTVEAGGIYHIIRLEKKMEPKAIKFADVKESLRQDLTDRLTQTQIKNLRTQLVDRIGATMTVDDPILAKQYELKKSQSDTAVHGNKEALDAMKREDRKASETMPNFSPEGLRPPATKPGAAAPGTSPSVKPSTRP